MTSVTKEYSQRVKANSLVTLNPKLQNAEKLAADGTIDHRNQSQSCSVCNLLQVLLPHNLQRIECAASC